MTSDPQDLGGPDLANPAWDPFWEVCADRHLPVHFHIGASVTGMTFYGKYFWPSQAEGTKLAIGGSLLFIGNARVVTNLILCRVFDRFPDLEIVSVESGVGWIPFILETLDYEMMENAPDELAKFQKPPSEYFKSNMYATFWFENNRNKLPELSRRSARTASSSRPTSRTPRASTPIRCRRWRPRCRPSPRGPGQDHGREQPPALPALRVTVG